jgi:DNA-directed RNA polymerase III subunit RPC11
LQSQNHRFFCQTCPYLQPMAGQLKVEKKLKVTRKKVDDVLGGEDAWQNVDQTDAQCPEPACGFGRAYYMQIQIRSADEPMTIFYKCAKCGKRWSG